MDRRKAKALIQQHRYWMSKETDYAIARRAEHGWTSGSLMMTTMAMSWMIHDGSLLMRFVPPVIMLVFASLSWRRSQQFMKIREEFEECWPQNYSDLDGKADTKTETQPPKDGVNRRFAGGGTGLTG